MPSPYANGHSLPLRVGAQPAVPLRCAAQFQSVPAQRAGNPVVGLLALGLLLYGWLQPRPVAPWHQNHILVGILLGMFAIIPSRSSEPPPVWQKQTS